MTKLYNLIYKFIKSIKNLYIYKCYECSKYIWLENLIELEACTDSCYYKLVCKSGCEFILDCGCKYKVPCPYRLDDKYINILCYKCNIITSKSLFWYGLSRYEYIKKYDS